jgi:acyl-CoA synthetase (NDP forming)
MDRTTVIDRLISPRSIAIIGASSEFSKINGRSMKHLIEKGYDPKQQL